MTNLGTQKIKNFIALLVIGVTDFNNAFSDKKITFWEGLGLVADIRSIPVLLLMLPQVKAEFADMDEAERKEVIAFVKGQLNLSSIGIEAIIEEGLDFASYAYLKSESIIEKIKALKNEV